MTTQKVDFSSMDVMAKLADINLNTREICDKWLLITYDLPVNEAGNRARAEFLSNAKLIGATRHTDSVYLLPWTKSAEALALRLAKHGEVHVWTAQTTSEERAEEITKNYDASLGPIMDNIVVRLDKVEEHLHEKRYKRAHKMMEKTERMINGLEQAIIRRGSAQLYIRMMLIKRRSELLG